MSGCTEAQTAEITEDTIRAMADVLVRRFHPKRIILFGSWARGTQTPDSDVDLLVVTRKNEGEPMDTGAKMATAVASFGVPKDIIVQSEELFERNRHLDWSITAEALRNGRSLYCEA